MGGILIILGLVSMLMSASVKNTAYKTTVRISFLPIVIGIILMILGGLMP